MMYTIDKSNLKQVVFLIISSFFLFYSISVIIAGFQLLAPDGYTNELRPQFLEIYLINMAHAYALLVVGIILFIKSKIIIKIDKKYKKSNV